ncbi:MAG TPA: Ku protein [Acidimicrobiales bacterium]|nr:Ku protein [Acidimicrobiales bacterium]
MPRAIWTGSLSFGLVNVPVGLFTATDDKTVHFNQFQAGTSDRIRMKRVNERTGEEVEYSDVVKGYDLGGGEYVIVTPEELESVEPGRSRTIEITDFVDLDDIDPIYYKSTYYIGPQGEQAARPYALLREAMAKSNKVAIATLVLRTKEHLVAIRPMRDVLALETMAFADEVRDPTAELPGLDVAAAFTGRELETAQLLIESMATEFDPTIYEDEYRKRVEQLIEEKRQGKAIVTERPVTEATPVVDLMKALQASVEAARAHRPGARMDGAAAGGRKAKAAPGARPAPTAPSRRPAAPKAADLSALSKAELQERAAELGIAGRSKMTRPELEAALSGSARAAKRRKAS